MGTGNASEFVETKCFRQIEHPGSRKGEPSNLGERFRESLLESFGERESAKEFARKSERERVYKRIAMHPKQVKSSYTQCQTRPTGKRRDRSISCHLSRRKSELKKRKYLLVI